MRRLIPGRFARAIVQHVGKQGRFLIFVRRSARHAEETGLTMPH